MPLFRKYNLHDRVRIKKRWTGLVGSIVGTIGQEFEASNNSSMANTYIVLLDKPTERYAALAILVTCLEYERDEDEIEFRLRN